MAQPVDELSLVAASIADDIGFVALHDLSEILQAAGLTEQCLLIGGYMMTLHVQRWHVALSRQTNDVDIGIPTLALKSVDLAQILVDRGYHRLRSNRFIKPVADLPVATGQQPTDHVATIDLLVPAYTSRRRTVAVGGVTTIEVEGLAEALRGPGIDLSLRLRRLKGGELNARLRIPDERSALVLKTYAWIARGAPKDAIDAWRGLEIAHRAGLGASSFASGDGRRAREELSAMFRRPDSPGMEAIAVEQGMAPAIRLQLHTRLQALLAALFQ